MSERIGVRLERFIGAEVDVPQGSFVHVLDRHVYGMMCTVVIGCPRCGAHTQLDREHAIDALGDVTPAVACSAGCGFFELVTLDGWRKLVG